MCGVLLTPLLQLKEAKHRQGHHVNHLVLNTELALFSKFLAGDASCVVPVESLLQQPLALPALVLGKLALGSPTFVKTSPSLSALHSTGL